jgi:antitoxin component YwqK of YwqJK toxin-antitoxin module
MIRILALLCVAPFVFACAFDHTNTDTAERPEIDVGTGGSIIYPGQPPPGMPDRRGSAGSSASGGAADATDDTTLLGGAGGEAETSTESRNVPLGPLTAIFGYPFWIFGKSVSEKADRAVEQRESGQPEPSGSEPPRPSGPDDLERHRVARENQAMLEQLGQRQQAAESRAPQSIGEELAALERALRPAPPQPEAAPPAPRAQDAVDRNGDGRPDLWVFAEEGSRRREALDEDHDGRPDREQTYGPDGRLERTEEDLDGDGRFESILIYEEGAPLRRRADTDRDGQVDTWSFYSAGELTRHEVDRDGDGFRDLILLYDRGQLAREEEDKNGDGRSDLITHYANGEVAQRDEDLDFDGVPDIQSYYENGKLVRREVRSEELLERHSGS